MRNLCNMLETSQGVTSSAWVATKILCTWKWPGNIAKASFLPLLCAYAKKSNFLDESLFDNILSMLFDGALVHGGDGVKSTISIWPVPDDMVESIEEPFLRALVSFLSTFLKEKIWATEKAMNLIKLLVNKLFIGEVVNTNCLKILPSLMSILLEPLFGCAESRRDPQYCSLEELFLQDTIKNWLDRALSLPPLITWQTGQDMEDWLHLVIAC